MRYYPFPKPQIWVNRPQPGGFASYESKVASWMIRCGFRYLRETFDRPGLEFPDCATLAEWMIDAGRQRGGEWFYKIDMEDRARYASHEVLRMYDPEAMVYVRAAKGGTKSRRGPSVTIDAVRDTTSLSIAQAAQTLGCSTATVKRRRAEIRRGQTDRNVQILLEMDRQIAAAKAPSDDGPGLQIAADVDDPLLDLLTESDYEIEEAFGEVPVTHMFDHLFAQYGMTRASFFADRPDRTGYYETGRWADEYMDVAV